MKKIVMCLALFSFCVFTYAQRKTEIVEPVKQNTTDAGK